MQGESIAGVDDIGSTSTNAMSRAHEKLNIAIAFTQQNNYYEKEKHRSTHFDDIQAPSQDSENM